MLYVLCGPPCSGKSTLARASGLPVLDWDDMYAAAAGVPQHARLGDPALAGRVEHQFREAVEAAYAARQDTVVIRAAPERRTRQLLRRLYAADVTVLEVPTDECITRLRASGRPADVLAATERAIVQWWWGYETDPADYVKGLGHRRPPPPTGLYLGPNPVAEPWGPATGRAGHPPSQGQPIIGGPASLAARRLALESGPDTSGAGHAAGATRAPEYQGAWAAISAGKRAGEPVCASCGVRGDQEHPGPSGGWVRARLTVHHRDGNTANLVDANLVVLCDTCHGRLTPANYTRG